MMKIRIKFRKYGTMKFIGHLDVMRYFQKAIRRSEVNIRYSEGFSPHQIMSFAAPLGVGITSKGEYVDIEVLDTENSQKMIDRLNGVMSEGFEILEYKLLPDAAANAMSIVAAADYSLTFRPGYEPEDVSPAQWFENLVHFFGADHVMIMKKTKKGEKEMDLKPFVYELKVRDEGETPALFMKVSAGSAANIKPELVLDAYYTSLGEERPQFAFMTEREEVYADTATAQEAEAGIHKFVTLGELGQDIV